MAKRLQVETDPAGPAPEATAQPYACVLGAWRAHEDELRGFLVKRLQDPDAAEDLLQESFLRALREGEGFCRLDDPRAWLFRVARNAAVDRERRQRPTEPVTEDIAETEPTSAPIDALEHCMRRNLTELAEPDRRIIEACDLGGMRQAEFAAEAGIGLNAAKSRLFRARRRLRERLVKHCRVGFDEAGRVCCHRPPSAGEEESVTD